MLDLKLVIKLGVSAVLGFVIGLERELKQKPLDLKTGLVVSMISCLITIVSIESAYRFPSNHIVGMDPLRLASQVVSGVGFLGAGVILRRRNDLISGLTTAAIIWGAAGLGIAVGAGFYIEAITGVILLLFSVELIPLITVKLGLKKLHNKDVIIKVSIGKQENIEWIMDLLIKEDIRVTHTRIKDMRDHSFHLLEMKAQVSMNRSIGEIYSTLKSIKYVKSVEISS